MDLEKNSFLLCFTAIIWKRIFSCLITYCEHKSIPLNSNDILKCLKYNLLAPSGMVEKLKPYIIKSLVNNFLMPKDYENNDYVKNAIKLFSQAYRISKLNNNKKEIDFIHLYASKAFIENAENEQEIKDLINDTIIDKNMESNFVELIDLWDIELGLVDSDDPYFKLMEHYLLSALNNKP